MPDWDELGDDPSIPIFDGDVWNAARRLLGEVKRLREENK